MFVYDTFSETDEFLKPLHNKNLSYHAHFHNCIELSFCISGAFSVTIDDRTFSLTENMAILVPPYAIHSYHTASHSEFYTILCSKSLIPDFAKLLSRKTPAHYVFEMDASLRALLTEFYTERKTRFAGKALLYRACDLFLSGNSFTEGTAPSNIVFLNAIEYMQDHFLEDITLESLSRHIGYTYPYVSRMLKKATGVTFTELLQEYRIEYAKNLLEKGAAPITQIALNSGFGSIRSFNRIFQHHTGKTPREYISAHTADDAGDVHFGGNA